MVGLPNKSLPTGPPTFNAGTISNSLHRFQAEIQANSRNFREIRGNSERKPPARAAPAPGRTAVGPAPAPRTRAGYLYISTGREPAGGGSRRASRSPPPCPRVPVRVPGGSPARCGPPCHPQRRAGKMFRQRRAAPERPGRVPRPAGSATPFPVLLAAFLAAFRPFPRFSALSGFLPAPRAPADRPRRPHPPLRTGTPSTVPPAFRRSSTGRPATPGHPGRTDRSGPGPPQPRSRPVPHRTPCPGRRKFPARPVPPPARPMAFSFPQDRAGFLLYQ